MTQSSTNPTELDLTQAFAAAMEMVDEAKVAQPASTEFNRFIETAFSNLSDGIIFVDLNRQIKLWNRTTELMTDIPAIRMLGNQLTPSLLTMKSTLGEEIQAENCPLSQCLSSQQRSCSDYKIAGRSGREIKVRLTCVPVLDEAQQMEGAVLVLNDASLQNDMSRQIKDLFQSSIVDPLTQLHNRSEFDRVLSQFIKAKCVSEFRCCLIVADIDFFKSINDKFNHHVGDQCLVAFADLLRTFVRSNDLVARFGGEEFVILCGNCDIATAVEKAEEIRATLNQTAMPMLNGKCITASFGVAELNHGENAKDFFVRADSALLKAKSTGRNKVVESGVTLDQASKRERRSPSATGLIWQNPAPSQALLLDEFVTSTSISMLVEKLRGYIYETKATIVSVNNNFAKLQIQVDDERGNKQAGCFIVEIEFQEGTPEPPTQGDRRRRPAPAKNFMRVAISEAKRKWFAKNANDLSAVAMRELRRFFMINDESAKLSIERAVTQSTRDQH